MKKLLIANRGEIAVRVIRTAREMGIRTVAVYSDADKDARHVAMADEAVRIGLPEPAASYLNIQAILEAVYTTHSDAVHPGYGFLSERPEFAEACEKAGVAFVGPSARAMRLLGSKSDAKRLAVDCDVPIVPGYFARNASSKDLHQAADTIGYPVMLKASAGGGGRGMRIVHASVDFENNLELASEEALKAFGDGSMMVEKLILRPHHIEIQALADQHSNVACSFERECSIQRRHQKLLEESPSPFKGFADETPDVLAATRSNLRRASEILLRKAGYVGAATVEFIVDEDSNRFYFLEVNTRLQVEHPVTEAVTGIDLVRQQLRIADCQPIDPNFDRNTIQGHAIEVRVVAEDPAAGFQPSVGKILAWAEPSGPGIRVDTGYACGDSISRYYDSLLAKVIVHAESRTAATAKMIRALQDFHILGVSTNIGYMLDVVSHPEFVAGAVDTEFLDREFVDWSEGGTPSELGSILSKAIQESYKGAWALRDGFRIGRLGPKT